MFNQSLKLNTKIFDSDTERVAIRKGFGDGLVKAGEQDERVVALCADLTESTFVAPFREKFPHRFVELGVAEQNLVSVASGMAAMGKIPFAVSFAIFSPGRNWEQVRTTICYNNVPVKIIGSHAGVSASLDGGSHQALEDIALMRVLPRMTVLSPCDAIEAKKATMASAKTDTPVYIRLAREATPVITTNETPFAIGKAQILWRSDLHSGGGLTSTEGNSVVGIIATGTMVYEALVAAQALEKDGIAVSVLNLATIKPLDTDAVLSLACTAGAIVTAEEHQKAGGMGSAVAEFLAERHPVPIEFIGVNDVFGQSGTFAQLLEHYGLNSKRIIEAAKKVIKRK